MRATILKTCGASIATLALGLSLITTPVMAASGWHGGGGGHGGGFHGGGFHGGGFHGGGFHGGGFHGGGWHGGGYGGGGYGYGAALGLGLLGGAIIGSQYPYYDSGYGYGYDPGYGYGGYPQGGGGDPSAYCASTYRSYDPASGTYLGYDGIRHPCP
ncbi:MAG TPA: BA14K family protein [Roseiarcus sp.]